MLIFILMFISFYEAYSQPLQENCTETETAFHDCLRKQYSEVIRSENMEGYKNQKSVFIQCGAKHSDCYLQKTLMTMIDPLTTEKPYDMKIVDNCYSNISTETHAKCKEKIIDQQGFPFASNQWSFETNKCIIEVAQNSKNCTQESIDEVLKHNEDLAKPSYRDKLSKFWLNVQINAITNDTKAGPLGPESCKDTEKEFRICLRSNTIMKKVKSRADRYIEQRTAFQQCGAESSDCNLQKRMMKIVNTLIDAKWNSSSVVMNIDEFKSYLMCLSKIDLLKMDITQAKCMREAFDEHGFSKSFWEFQSEKERCYAKLAQKSEFCTSTDVEKFVEETHWNNMMALLEFTHHLDS